MGLLSKIKGVLKRAVTWQVFRGNKGLIEGAADIDRKPRNREERDAERRAGMAVDQEYAERMEFYKQDREKRELRLERKSLKFLDARHKRHRKNKEGRSGSTADADKDYIRKLGSLKGRDLSPEEAIELERQGAVVPMLPHKASDVTRLLTSAAEAALAEDLGEYYKEKFDKLPKYPEGKFTPEEEEDFEIPIEVAEGGAEAIAEHVQVPTGLSTETEAATYAPVALTPAERNGFSPTLAEYKGEMLPAYLRTQDTAPEVIERYHELEHAKKVYQDAVKRRESQRGILSCDPDRPWIKGHEWWKVPGQPEFECMQCGTNINTQFADLRDGKLRRIEGAFTRDVREALSKLGTGDAKFLGAGTLAGIPQLTVDSLADASRVLVAKGALTRMPEPVRDLVNMEVGHAPIQLDAVGDARGFLFKLNEETFDLCLNCGCTKSVHAPETVIGIAERSIGKLLHCPSLSKDPV